eukprot:3167347-Rhodomonas_salina.2
MEGSCHRDVVLNMNNVFDVSVSTVHVVFRLPLLHCTADGHDRLGSGTSVSKGVTSSWLKLVT